MYSPILCPLLSIIPREHLILCLKKAKAGLFLPEDYPLCELSGVNFRPLFLNINIIYLSLSIYLYLYLACMFVYMYIFTHI